jgi:hypothetical protein
MKLVLLFFFAITTPFFIFLTEVLYGGTNPAVLKSGLVETSVYSDISEFLINAEPEGEQNDSTSEISKLVYNRFTPQYIQIKTEKLIDDSHVWITQDGPSPVLSFSDIKDDLLISNPEFESQFNQIAEVSDQQSLQGEINAEESLNEYAGAPEAQKEINSIAALAQNNFTVPVGEYFSGIKNFYSIMKIIHPLVAVLLGLSLFTLIKINNSWHERFRWIGGTFITTAIFGFGMVLFNYLAVQHLMEVTSSNAENFLSAFAPIMLQLMNLFMKVYGNFQNIISTTMLILGIIFLVLGFIPSNSPSKPIAAIKK